MLLLMLLMLLLLVLLLVLLLLLLGDHSSCFLMDILPLIFPVIMDQGHALLLRCRANPDLYVPSGSVITDQWPREAAPPGFDLK